MPYQKQIWRRCLGGFSVKWVTKLLISPVKKGFFAQKWPNLARNWHFCSIWARPCRLIQCPVGGSVGGCGARAVSRKTPIYFIILITNSPFLSRSGDLRKVLHPQDSQVSFCIFEHFNLLCLPKLYRCGDKNTLSTYFVHREAINKRNIWKLFMKGAWGCENSINLWNIFILNDSF